LYDHLLVLVCYHTWKISVALKLMVVALPLRSLKLLVYSMFWICGLCCHVVAGKTNEVNT
jgi:hypothetical protein